MPANALPWLYAVARKTLANERRRCNRPVQASVDIEFAPEPMGDSALAAAFAELSDLDREVLRPSRGRGCRSARPRTCSIARRSRARPLPPRGQPRGAAAYLETFDAQGNVLSKQKLP